ncbi:MAG: hypothetical protein ACI9S8_002613 [Chlamydiales bacterium]|jgi:hypothetical protein
MSGGLGSSSGSGGVEDFHYEPVNLVGGDDSLPDIRQETSRSPPQIAQIAQSAQKLIYLLGPRGGQPTTLERQRRVRKLLAQITPNGGNSKVGPVSHKINRAIETNQARSPKLTERNIKLMNGGGA